MAQHFRSPTRRLLQAGLALGLVMALAACVEPRIDQRGNKPD